MPHTTRDLERLLGDMVRARLPQRWREPVLFVLKHLWAGVYGGILLVAMTLTRILWNSDWPVARYDVLLAVAVLALAAFLWTRVESVPEARAMALFGLPGLGMEWFKVGAGNWSYPEPGHLVLFDVPLFVGFMYAAVASCILRMIRLFDMRFAPFPPFAASVGLAALIYVNFFTSHMLPDIRIALFAGSVALFWRTRIWFRVAGRDYWMPMLLSTVLSALGIWLAENLGTLTGTWLYDGQSPGEKVSLATLGSWYLFLLVAFSAVSTQCRHALSRQPVRRRQR
ncbi:MAG: putative integral membrane protein [Rhodobacteraceae bacterium HLUCCA12]|nr:MAG: putative integral membrane protein [Rhodobacteraceae bacterium HLUCCA12]